MIDNGVVYLVAAYSGALLLCGAYTLRLIMLRRRLRRRGPGA